MSKIKLATASQVADVVRITTDAGLDVDVSGTTPVPARLSHTRFCHVDPDEPTQIVLSRRGLYSIQPVDNDNATYVGVGAGAPALREPGSVLTVQGGSLASTGTTTGSNTEGVLLYLLIPMDGVSPEPEAED